MPLALFDLCLIHFARFDPPFAATGKLCVQAQMLSPSVAADVFWFVAGAAHAIRFVLYDYFVKRDAAKLSARFCYHT